MDSSPHTENLRAHLRSATADAHDRLDGGMERFDLASPRGYAAFLSIQLAAREPIEEWCAAHAPDGLTPPAQSALIRADLADLGFDTPTDTPASGADLGEPLGVAWALGGSSLGNRAMLAHLKKRVGDDWPVRFLADEAMPAYWKTLRPTLEGPADAATTEAATHAALAVFARFEAALAAHERQAAA